jgi:DNA polymerase III sliding clamp (beta) subunit (PCNA family)
MILIATGVIVSVSVFAPASHAADSKGAPNDERVVSFKVRSTELYEGLRRTQFAVGKTKTEQYDWDVVVLEATPTLLTLVATDGRRMAIVELPVKTEHPVAVDSVVCSLTPNATRTLIESLKGVDGEIEVRLSPEELAAALGPKQWRLPTQVARFPDWRRAVPKSDAAAEFKVDVDAFLLAVVRAEPDSPTEEPPVVAMTLSYD